ncbi:nuclease domain-containing protein [Photobacterium carnosum]|uniref:nuclease domain-containing protein n=1 Tax=Photobacterium carnosum TaxID=2023717 RepID=UPI001E436864|nr:nuclease domain-containing protein [Photobacterium carnosum]MCD9550838.1 hypothetical protein [Photobacterium carnosum]MCD9551506.1 hypothetical protein [Photobacterium carnosum]MCF2307981.1 hypothetical protein [Photobacterium carnosum]
MQLDILILSGNRYEHTIKLNSISEFCAPIDWLREDEVIEFRLTTSNQFTNAKLNLYDHNIEPTIIDMADNYCTFRWTPKKRWNGPLEYAFHNFFGIAELSVSLININGEEVIQNFHPIDILASKANAENVDNMFKFLAKFDDETLHSAFETTKQPSSFKEGNCTPNGYLERLESTLQHLLNVIGEISAKPITKLVAHYNIMSTTGEELLDDSSLGWLMSNLSELEETDDKQRAHIEHESKYFKASTIEVAELIENTDIYENQVIHGFILFLIRKVKYQLNKYDADILTYAHPSQNHPDGYVSFFDQLKKFKTRLFSQQVTRCIFVQNNLLRLKNELEKRIPVSTAYLNRPILTHKAKNIASYRAIFLEYIMWIEANDPDWGTSKNLFAIKNIPTLFEIYCFYRIRIAICEIFDISKLTGNTFFINEKNAKLTILREPIYWMPRHKKSVGNYFINSEGMSSYNKKLSVRSHTDSKSHRCPDLVIEINIEGKEPKLIILDAKYQKGQKAFQVSLPECTMKYVHGINYAKHLGNPVDSLTLLHPYSDRSFTSFHNDEYNIFSAFPIKPALQCVGLKLGESSEEDQLNIIIKQLLISSGIIDSIYK